MTIRNHSTALLILATLTGCAVQPAYADVLLNPANLPRDPVHPERRPTAYSDPNLSLGGPAADAYRIGNAAPPASSGTQPVLSWGGWWAPQSAGQVPLTVAPSLVNCRPQPVSVPVPVGLLVPAAAFVYSRKLRQRISK